MEEIKSVLTFIPLWFYEKLKLRKFQGRSRPNNSSNKKRNDLFYKKLENRLIPFLESLGYQKKKKRLFISKNIDSISYINFAQNNRLNGICIDYGNILKKKIDRDNKNGIDSIVMDTQFKRLKPGFWNFDYQYPIRKSDKYDDLILTEIKTLLFEKLNVKQQSV